MVGELIAGRYELVELVGTGGMSSVYRAYDRLLERDVALKILHESHAADPDTIERFRREARAVAQLSHPNIVRVIDRGDDAGRQYIVFEYLDGENLHALVERTGPLPVRGALEAAIQVGYALAFAHRHGIVHRDVKPQNVLVSGDGTAKITDFGIARSLELSAVTEAGTVLGTSRYIAPEQASGAPVGPYTDVYSLGVVLYELLTGSPPFAGDNFVAVAMQHVHDDVPRLLDRRPDVPLRVARAVERALAKDPEDRFSSMDEFVAELESCLAELGRDPESDATLIVPRQVVRESRRRPVRARRSRVPLVLLATGLVLAAAVAAAVLALDPGGESPRAGAPVVLRAVSSYDPEGDGREHDELVTRATDRNRATYWTTETYQSFEATKSGVGIVLDAGAPVSLSEIIVSTDSAGFTAEIRAGGSPRGPFHSVSPRRTTGRSTTFPVEGEPARYYLVWITALDGFARVNEVRARG